VEEKKHRGHIFRPEQKCQVICRSQNMIQQSVPLGLWLLVTQKISLDDLALLATAPALTSYARRLSFTLPLLLTLSQFALVLTLIFALSLPRLFCEGSSDTVPSGRPAFTSRCKNVIYCQPNISWIKATQIHKCWLKVNRSTA
jgi:hypothetical protein